jgi:hypothetical protein
MNSHNISHTSRRSFLTKAAGAALASVPPLDAQATTKSKSLGLERGNMNIICVEEHFIDLNFAKASQPAMMKEAPYMALSFKGEAASPSRDRHHPSFVT